MSTYPMNNVSVKNAALQYAGSGFAVVPVIPFGPVKKPFLSAWQKRYARNTEDVELMWQQWPEANVGLVTGRTDNMSFWVLDIDFEEDENGVVVKDGYVELAKLEEEFGPLPPTWTVTTGRGGRHYYFRLADGQDISNTTGIRKDIDVRGQNGFVVAAPSIHNETRKPYLLDVSAMSMAEAPPWLVDLVTKKARQLEAKKLKEKERRALKKTDAATSDDWNPSRHECEVSLTRAQEEVRNAPAGMRHATLRDKTLRIAKLYMGEGRLKEEEIEAGMSLAGLESGLSVDEVSNTIIWAINTAIDALEKGEVYPPERTDRTAQGAAFMDAVIAAVTTPPPTGGGTTPPPTTPPPPTGGGNGGGGGGAPPPPPAQPAAQPAAQPGRPVIQVNRQGHLVKADAWTAVQARFGDDLFVADNGVVRILRAPTGDVRLEEVNTAAMFCYLTDSADWVTRTVSQRSGVVISPAHIPDRLPGAMLQDYQMPLREVVNLSRHPQWVVRGDSIVMLTSGSYDAETKTLSSDHGLGFTRVAKEEAVEFLNHWVSGCGFVDEASKTNALGLFMLPFVRPIIDAPTPLHLVSAASEGSGKTTVVRMMLMPSQGYAPAVSPWVFDQNEMDKRVLSYLMERRAVIFFDNVEAERGPLRSPIIDAVLTSPAYDGRILGENKSKAPPNKAVWAMTMNSGSMSRDMSRRTVLVKVVKPEKSKRVIPDIEAWTKANRQTLINCAMSLVMEWAEAGCPKPASDPLPSFELWSHVVGGVLENAGFRDFNGNRVRLDAEVNTEQADFEYLVEAMWKKMTGGPTRLPHLTYDDILTMCDTMMILQHKLGGNTDQARRNAVINMMNNNIGRVVNGIKIAKARTKVCMVITLIEEATRKEYEEKVKAEEEAQAEEAKRFAAGFIKP